MEVGIYIKSHFRGNPKGPGEAAAVIEYIDRTGKSHLRRQSVQVVYATKNAMHLKICIAAVRILLKHCRVTIHMDCDYIGNACRLGWPGKWKQDGWRKADGKPPANVEDWKQFYMLAQIHTIVFAPYDRRYDEELEKLLDIPGI